MRELRVVQPGWPDPASDARGGTRGTRVAAVLAITYRGRRLDSLRQLVERIAASGQLAEGWTVGDVYDALTIITGIEAFEALMRDHDRTADDAGETLFRMTRAFFA